LEFTIVDNWGDNDFIAINGIDVFDDEGKQIIVKANDIKLKILTKALINHSNPERLIKGKVLTNDHNKVWIIKRIENYFPKIYIELH